MKSVIIICQILLLSNFGIGQQKLDAIKNFNQSIYAEFFGNCDCPISINYERIIPRVKDKLINYSIRIGFGTYKRGVDTVRLYNIPLEVIAFLGKKTHFIESSIGLTCSIGKNFTDLSVSPPKQYHKFDKIYSLRIGYRYVGKDGITFRISPLLIHLINYNTPKLMFTFGVAGGISF